MRLLNVNGAPAARRKALARLGRSVRPSPTTIRTRPRIRARGHAAEIFLLLFATDLAVTKRCVLLAAARLVTAAMIAVKPYGACWIANVNGWLATAKRDDSNVAASIRPDVARGVLVHLSATC